MMMYLSRRMRGSSMAALSLSIMLGLGASPAWAQQAGAKGEAGLTPNADLEQARGATLTGEDAIIVTGSRLSRTGFTSPTPVTVLGAEQLQRVGDTNVADSLNRMPSFRPQNTPLTQGYTQSNLASQILDLRGLGAQRTLVLVDGRRHVATTTQGTFDLSMMPSAIIDRVEVVTGGASAAYGSDAVAGVVNLIINDSLNGAKGQVQYGLSRAGDNKEISASLAIGSDLFGGAGHIVVAGEYVRNNGLGDCFSRDWCSPDGVSNTFTIANPRNPAEPGFPATVIGLVKVANMTPAGIITSGPLRGVHFNADGSVAAAPFGYGKLATNVSVYMLGGEGKQYFHDGLLFGPSSERFSLYQNLHYDFSPSLRGVLSASFGQVNAQTNAANPLDSGNLIIRRDNAYLPAAIAARMDDPNGDGSTADAITQFNFGRVTNDVGQARTFAKRSVFRVVGALEGKLGDNWTWDAYYQFGRTDSDQYTQNNRITANFTRALDSVRNVQNVPVCRSTLSDPGNGCSPINPFGIGNIQRSAVAYAFGTSTSSFRFTQHAAAANLQGTLLEGWAGPISLAAGAEWRKDSALGVGDNISTASGFFTNNTAMINGRISVVEGYLETVVPLLREQAFTHLLELNGAVRRTHYERQNDANPKSTVNATTWKVGAVWEPIEAIRFRVTRSRDIRAPNNVELFSSLASTNTFISDPANNQAYNVLTFTGGNTALAPEKADTTTIGIVVKPGAGVIPGRVRFSADYYNIDLAGAIATLGAQLLVNRCAAGSAEFCAQLTRDPNTKLLTRIVNTNLNLNKLQARGIDFELTYALPLADVTSALPGNLSFRVLANRALELSTTDPAGVTTNRAGQNGAPISQLSGVPDWVIDADVTYSSGPFSASVQMHHLTSGVYDVTMVGPEQAGYDPISRNSISTNHVAGRTYFNLAASYRLSNKVELFGAITNLFDVSPPIAPSSTGPFNATLYDPIGQNFRFGVRAQF